MRLYTRTRLVLSCIVPCYLIIGFLVSSFLAMWKSEVERDLRTRAALVADELAALIAHNRAENLESQLGKRAASRPWLRQISILDGYGRVVASDGSSLGREGILAHDVARRRQITNTTEPLFLPETFEYFQPCAIGSRSYIIRVGLEPGAVHGRIWWALRWFLPGWVIAGLMTLLLALYLSRLSLERMVSSMANQVARVGDGKSPEPLLVNEPALEPLADGLRRLFRSIEADRGRMGNLERNIAETRDRATHSRQETERLLLEKETALTLQLEESRLLRERCGSGILRLGPDAQILAVNRPARHWLSLGPHPDPADLPRGLCQIVECANNSPALTPAHGTVVARHPFFGHERRLDVTCIPLGEAPLPEGKPMLIFLEEHSGSKAAPAANYSLEGFLRLLKGAAVVVGQDLHALETLKRGPERSARSHHILQRLARIVRDLETLIGFDRMSEMLEGSVNQTSPVGNLAPAAIQASRYAGVPAGLRMDPEPDATEPAARDLHLALSSDLLDVILRETFAVVGDLNTGPSLRFTTRLLETCVEATVSAPALEEEGALFVQTIAQYLSRSDDMRRNSDMIALRIEILRRIIDYAGGRLDISPDRRGLLIAIPLAPESVWRSEADEAQSLTRAFLS